MHAHPVRTPRPMNTPINTVTCRFSRWGIGAALGTALLCAHLPAQPTQSAAAPTLLPAKSERARTALFIGNSYFYGARSPVHFFRPQSVTDLNNSGVGGVPALFKIFTAEAGLDFAVSLETVGGSNLDLHLKEKAPLIVKRWDVVFMLGQSMLDNRKPGDATTLVGAVKQLTELLVKENPRVDIRLVSTWSRADVTYLPDGHWKGKPIEQMALDVRAGYDQAAAAAPAVRRVIAVGEAWNRAIKTGVADANPYDGLEAGKINLWTYDGHHASAFGYYLEALVIFGDLTGFDPRSLGPKERGAYELGLSPEQTAALQQVAYDELMAARERPSLRQFTPVSVVPK